MYSLISTIESIFLAARGQTIKALENLSLLYLNTVGVALNEADYSIPSLIWPPPKAAIQQHFIPSISPLPLLLFLGQEKVGSTWLQQ